MCDLFQVQERAQLLDAFSQSYMNLFLSYTKNNALYFIWICKMPLVNYREFGIVVQGSLMLVGGFKKPESSNDCQELKAHGVEAVINLRGDGVNWDERYAQKLKLAGFDLKYYFDNRSTPPIYIHDYFDDVVGAQVKPINPEIYDRIYAAVLKAQEAGKKVAIFCGSGNGRTGTALACLKLRELVEQEFLGNPAGFSKLPNDRSASVHVEQLRHMQKGDGYIPVTPMVKLAIEHIRAVNKSALELANDVETVLQYEQHLRQEFVQRLSGDAGPIPMFVDSSIPRLEIRYGYDYWQLIHKYAPSEYLELIKQATIKEGGFFRPFSELIRDYLGDPPLTERQKQAFAEALAAHEGKVGGVENILNFLIKAGVYLPLESYSPVALMEKKLLMPAVIEAETLVWILNAYPKEQRLQLLLQTDPEGRTVASKAIAILPAVFPLLDKEVVSGLLQSVRDQEGRPALLAIFLKMRSITREVLMTLSFYYPDQPAYKAALLEKDAQSNSAIKKILKQDFALNLAIEVLGLFSTQEQSALIQETPSFLLSLAYKHPQEFLKFLFLIPTEVGRKDILAQTGALGLVFGLLPKTPEVLSELSRLVGMRGLHELIQIGAQSISMKNNLCYYAGNGETLKNLLLYYPLEDRLAALQIHVEPQDRFTKTWKVLFKEAVQELPEILSLLPLAQRFEAVKAGVLNPGEDPALLSSASILERVKDLSKSFPEVYQRLHDLLHSEMDKKAGMAAGVFMEQENDPKKLRRSSKADDINGLAGTGGETRSQL